MEEELIVGGVSNEQPYDKIDKLNASLTELANDVHGISVEPVANEIKMPSVSTIEVQNDLEAREEVNIAEPVVDEEQAALVKEITTSDEEDATNEPSSKGQFILIGILSFILIVLLVAMVIFTNAL